MATAGIDITSFRDVCAQFASGVTIVTATDDEGKPWGLTVSSFSAVSLTPPMILVCIGHNSGELPQFRKSSYFAVNILHAGQEALSGRFAALGEERFAGVDWRPGEKGSPLLSDCLAWMECLTHKIVDAGDHAVFFGEVTGGAVNGGAPLLYFDRDYRSITSTKPEGAGPRSTT